MLLCACATQLHCLMPSLSDSQNPPAAPSCLSLESLLPSDAQGLQSLVLTLVPAVHTSMPIQVPSQPQASPSFLPAHTSLSPGNDLPHSPSFQNVTSRTLSLSAPQRSSLHPKGLLFALTSFPVHCSDHLFKRNSPLSTLRAFFLYFFSGFITFSFTFFPWVPLMTRPSGWPMTAGTQSHLEHRPPAGLPS